jgi:RNA polymerase sigma-70 factor (ECF subfamily)
MAKDPAEVRISQLVDENYQAVYRYAYRLSGNLADAEDLTQRVFLAAQRNLGQLRKINRSQTWLFTILRNLFLREHQRKRPKVESELSLDLNRFPHAIPALEEVTSQELQEALNRLPEMARLVLAMFYFEECSYREIAERLELPMGTVMSRLARAKAALRMELLDGAPKKQMYPVSLTAPGG